MEETKEFNISYTTLFELLRREKDREELQKLQKTFFEDVKSYIQEKQKAASESTLTNFEDKPKIEKELNNIKKILKELYEKRERKIVLMALDRSRIKTNIVDSALMLKEEKELFDSLVNVLDENREYIALRLFSQEPAENEMKEEPEKEPAIKSKPPLELNDNALKKDTKLVRFTHAVPKFVGKELEEYGPFEEEDIANLPIDIAQILIDKGRAEEINQ